jgi:energy-coupling factor transporter ATP-binding protein EcfA2
MFKTETYYNFIELYKAIIKHIPTKEYKKDDIVIYNNKFYTIVEVLDNNIEILAIENYKISDKIKIRKNDIKLETINEKKKYQKISELIKFVKDYNQVVWFLNKRDVYIKTLDNKDINNLIYLLLNTSVKINTLNKILFELKKSHNNKYEIIKLFINPYNFIEENNSYISFKLAEKIEELWKIKIDFKIKLEAKIKSVIIENYSSNSYSFYIIKQKFYKIIEDYCNECKESYKNYKLFIDEEIMQIDFIISKIKLEELGNSKMNFGKYKDYTMKYTHENYKSLIKWYNEQPDPSQQMQKYIKYVNGKETYITSKYFWDLEEKITQTIMELYNKDNEDNEDYDKEEVYNFIIDFEKKRTKEKNISYKLDDIQKQAIFDILNNKFLILTGPPGSGKTDIVGCVLYIMEKYCNEEELLINKTCIMAPTGQAYSNICKSMESKYYYSRLSGTCHKILLNIFQKKCEIEYNNENKINYKDHDEDEEFNNSKFNFVIIDEFSMIDLNILNLILRLCKKYNSKLLIIGDPKQFPPIGPGNPLKSLIQSKKFITCNLVKIYRQQENTSLLNMIKKMNDGEKITYHDFDKDEFTIFINISDIYNNLRNYEVLKNYIYNIIDTYKLGKDTKFLSYNTSNTKLVNGTTKFIFNVPILNKLIQDKFNPNKKGFENEIITSINYYDKEFRVGDKIIRTENEYNGDDFKANGDEGEILEYDDEKVTICYNSNEKKRYIISINKLFEEFDLNYATGFHKSQGSGWTTIVVFIEPNASFIKQKAIYTSISRSKEKLLLICRPEDLLNCQSPEDERRSLFMNKIHYNT